VFEAIGLDAGPGPARYFHRDRQAGSAGVGLDGPSRAEGRRAACARLPERARNAIPRAAARLAIGGEYQWRARRRSSSVQPGDGVSCCSTPTRTGQYDVFKS